MVVISGAPRFAHQVAAVIFVIFGLVAMHQLVASGCAMLPASEAAQASDTHVAWNSHAGHDVSNPQWAGAAPTEAEPHIGLASLSPVSSSDWNSHAGELSICIAILILIVVMRKPAAVSFKRWRAIFRSPQSLLGQRSTAPAPDRQLLSISRT